jgi:transcriptional regulator with XRE-family HTH domain
MSTDLHRPAPQWTFGDRTRKIRREMRLSQIAFAQLIGRGEKAVAAWEAGSKPEDVVAVAQEIESATGYDAAWVLGVTRQKHGDSAALLDLADAA